MNVFSSAELDKVISETIPAGTMTDHTHAIVGSVDQNGAQIVASFKNTGSKWEFQAAAQHEWNGTNSVGAKVLLSW